MILLIIYSRVSPAITTRVIYRWRVCRVRVIRAVAAVGAAISPVRIIDGIVAVLAPVTAIRIACRVGIVWVGAEITQIFAGLTVLQMWRLGLGNGNCERKKNGRNDKWWFHSSSPFS
jgi:hypothetical protein